MKRLLILSLFTSITAVSAADQMSPIELKLREQLKAVMLQLRDAQTQMATLQATQMENELKIKDLSTNLETLTKESTDYKLASEKTMTDLNAKVAAQDTEITQLQTALDKWKKGYNQVAELAKAKEAQRAKFEAEKIQLQRRVDDQKVKNNAMFKLGNEILDRYKSFGLGDALTAREPFIGTTRIKFENLIQDYSDGLEDQKIKP